jgi:outer membrane protein TolC
MSWMVQGARGLALVATAMVWSGGAAAQTLSVEEAVRLALERNVGIVGAEAGLDEARGAQYSALAGVLPSVSLNASRSGFWEERQTGAQVFGTQIFATPENDFESYSTTPTLNASWQVLNLASLTGLSAARTGVRAALDRRQARRNDVSYETRQEFYDVVRAVLTADVNARALSLARDEERRVRALFEVGSVSRSDLLQAQVRTAQSELDSLISRNAVLSRRLTLADQLGMAEGEMGAVDTSLTATVQTFDPAQVTEEATRSRPDLSAAEAEYKAAKASLRAASFRRLPYLSLSGGATFNPRSSSKTTILALDSTFAASNESDREYRASIALNWNIFDGFATDAGIATARAREMRAQSAYEQQRRNLEGEVRQVLLAYREATEGHQVASRALESAEESHKLIQQKYNVGSATILELINAQVQLQRAANDEVAARAAIKVAEAAVARVRGVSQ